MQGASQMTTGISEIDCLIQRELEAGNYADEADVLRHALHLLTQRRESLEAIRRGLDDIAAGRTVAFDDFDREFRERKGIGRR
jgi:Arc/MetJ-type ribon-helix-helix transcriptional regulator